MALIKCPECGKEISDASKQCIYCGFPLEKEDKNIFQDGEGENRYKIILENAGNSKSDVIKEVCEITGLGSVDAKALVDAAPSCILSNLTEVQAKEYLEKLESAGAIARIEVDRKPIDSPNLMDCPICSKKVSKDAPRCPHCGHQFVDEKKGIGFWGIVGAIIVAVLIMAFC